ncbi:MAG: transcriptional regulator [Bryobacterales bacterium]|nr:transcriptional regulator [Bryobacterales bacterium]
MTINVELRDDQAARLDRFATSLRKSRGEATAQLIEEGLRHAEFPAIEFRDSLVGRQAYVVGSRLAVWEVSMIAEGYGLEVAATAQHLQLDHDRVSQALRYASVFESEVREALAENRAITLDNLRASLPPGAWVDIR